MALINGGSIRADSLISPGQLTTREILQILPFKNRVVKVQVNGDTLRQALEHGVARSAEDAEPGRFPQISGIRFTFDASRKPGSRITAVTVNGKPLLEKKLYTLATTTFVALDGGDDYKMFKGAPLLLAPERGQIDSEILRKAIASVRSIAPQTDGRIKRLDQNRSQIVDCE